MVMGLGRSMRSRWAVSRHQPLGWARWATHWVGEGLDEIAGGSLSEGGAWAEGSGFVDDAKDPSEVERLGKVALSDLVAQISGEEIFVL